MKMTLEISMYPLRDDYIPPIDAFIATLNSYSGLEVVTTPTATRVVGDYQQIMAMMTEAMAASYERYGSAVFVTKFIPGYTAE